MDPKKTFFIVIEGIDGSGKSSIAPQLVEALQESFGNNVKLTFEPHDPSCAGVFIRQVLMKKIINVPLSTLALAFATNRADHCDREIIPFLERVNSKPRVIVCDRYYLSSLVYQTSDEITFEHVMALNENARKPDLTIFLNASDKVCYERMRNRQEDKELFEHHLSKTRKKYADAIEFLRNRGDKIVEVNADGKMAHVSGLVLKAILQNSPNWFSKIQMPVPFDPPTDLFEQADISVISVAKKVNRFWNSGPLSSKSQLTQILKEMETEIDNIVSELEFNPCASLFFDTLKSSGYERLDKLPWLDLDAFEIRFTMPLGLKQYGAALLLGRSQRYDAPLKKLLSEKKVQTLDRMSDFLFIFDSNPSHLISHHYERDIIKYAKNSSLSPSVTVIGRKQIANMVLNGAVEMFQEEHMFTLRKFPKLEETLIEFRNAKSSFPEWNGSH